MLIADNRQLIASLSQRCGQNRSAAETVRNGSATVRVWMLVGFCLFVCLFVCAEHIIVGLLFQTRCFHPLKYTFHSHSELLAKHERHWLTKTSIEGVKIDRQTDRQTDRDRETERQTDRETETETDRQTERRRQRQTDRDREVKTTEREGSRPPSPPPSPYPTHLPICPPHPPPPHTHITH